MTFGTVFAYKFQKELAKRATVMNIFGKFVSPKVLATLLKNQDNLALKSTRKHITVLFCDIKDFTTLSEKCNPEQLLDNLNEVFNEIVNIIFENNGTVDKFIGDSIMAYWGDPIRSEDDAFMAVKTALEIKKKINELKVKNAQEGKIIFDIKIGVNTGEALLGLSGSEKIMSYTAMGDAVNVASRLESNCSKLERDILISKSTYDDTKSRIVALEAGQIKVKGRDEHIETYEPIGLREE
jgi:adenylate cyclase